MAWSLNRVLDTLHQTAKTIMPGDAQAYFEHAEDFSLATV